MTTPQTEAQMIAALTESIRQVEAKKLLTEILERLNDEADIDWSGGPNLAMRLQSQFGARIEAAIRGES